MSISIAFRAVWDSFVRTFVPIVVASVVAFFARTGISLDDEATNAIAGLLGAVAGGLYYYLARVIETLRPKWSKWLLLSSKQPVYETPATPENGPELARGYVTVVTPRDDEGAKRDSEYPGA